jgi:hypothetical protein
MEKNKKHHKVNPEPCGSGINAHKVTARSAISMLLPCLHENLIADYWLMYRMCQQQHLDGPATRAVIWA